MRALGEVTNIQDAMPHVAIRLLNEDIVILPESLIRDFVSGGAEIPPEIGRAVMSHWFELAFGG